ncbi:helix-turn-helix domain-containing protein [Alicyclobacillus fastidiosus]|uniref:helix-turn-helix domain-containing protein n=1 Tax=Alicyclobacillus fastidiosus TaxID=392011 RepID=UPI0023E9B655|nr:helix-turn-helix transcriptional regulator [Alicyclobacillus fastidiosus]GMA65782.1 hypothetical protein GCM10025859_62220 [Alicyclobacillus fastidiosus]
MSNLSTRLMECRKRKGWTQSFVSEKTGITNFALSKYERGTREPDTSTLSILATLYDVSIDYLVNGDSRELDLFEILHYDHLLFRGTQLTAEERSKAITILMALFSQS